MKHKIPHPKELNLTNLVNSTEMVCIGVKVQGREKLKLAQSANSMGLTLTAYCAELLISSAKKVDALGNAIILKEQTINQLMEEIRNTKQAVVAAPEIIYGEAVEPEIKYVDADNLKTTEQITPVKENSFYAFFQGKK